MKVADALAGAIDSNFYMLSDLDNERRLLAFAIGLPFARSDGFWEFRFFRVRALTADTTGRSFEHMAGWMIEDVKIAGNLLSIVGDEISLELGLYPMAVGTYASVLLKEYPDVEQDDSARELQKYLDDPLVTWQEITL